MYPIFYRYASLTQISTRFIGLEDGDNAMKKSRKEIISEMIGKSKLTKHEKQKQRLDAQNLTDELDEQWRNALKDNWFSQMLPVAVSEDNDTAKK